MDNHLADPSPRVPGGMKHAIGTLVVVTALASIATLGSAGAQQLPALECKGKPATVVGSSEKDRIVASNGRDVIVSRGGNDLIRARGGNDLVCSGQGQDQVSAGAGSDRAFGGGGHDYIEGAGSSDRLVGGRAWDVLVGEAGPRDVCLGGKPTSDSRNRSDYAERSCERMRSARRIVFPRF